MFIIEIDTNPKANRRIIYGNSVFTIAIDVPEIIRKENNDKKNKKKKRKM